ncbi:hypothetical protein HUJ04_008737 [Dendroctonus ponderosae]|nr:hypothetical protein HUJ04_008737 [Dendroctonus ponderosae]
MTMPKFLVDDRKRRTLEENKRLSREKKRFTIHNSGEDEQRHGYAYVLCFCLLARGIIKEKTSHPNVLMKPND